MRWYLERRAERLLLVRQLRQQRTRAVHVLLHALHGGRVLAQLRLEPYRSFEQRGTDDERVASHMR